MDESEKSAVGCIIVFSVASLPFLIGAVIGAVVCALVL